MLAESTPTGDVLSVFFGWATPESARSWIVRVTSQAPQVSIIIVVVLFPRTH